MAAPDFNSLSGVLDKDTLASIMQAYDSQMVNAGSSPAFTSYQVDDGTGSGTMQTRYVDQFGNDLSASQVTPQKDDLGNPTYSGLTADEINSKFDPQAIKDTYLYGSPDAAKYVRNYLTTQGYTGNADDLAVKNRHAQSGLAGFYGTPTAGELFGVGGGGSTGTNRTTAASDLGIASGIFGLAGVNSPFTPEQTSADFQNLTNFGAQQAAQRSAVDSNAKDPEIGLAEFGLGAAGGVLGGEAAAGGEAAGATGVADAGAGEGSLQFASAASPTYDVPPVDVSDLDAVDNASLNDAQLGQNIATNTGVPYTNADINDLQLGQDIGRASQTPVIAPDSQGSDSGASSPATLLPGVSAPDSILAPTDSGLSGVIDPSGLSGGGASPLAAGDMATSSPAFAGGGATDFATPTDFPASSGSNADVQRAIDEGVAKVDNPASDDNLVEKALKQLGLEGKTGGLGLNALPLGITALSQLNANRSSKDLASQLKAAGAASSNASNQLLNEGLSGTVSPAMITQYNNTFKDKVNEINQRYANMGRDPKTDSAAQAEIQKAQDARDAAIAGNAQQLTQQGLTAAQIAQGPATQSAIAAAQKDQNLQNAMAQMLQSLALFQALQKGGSS